MANQYRVKTGVKLYTQVLEQVKSMIAQGVYKKGDLLIQLDRLAKKLREQRFKNGAVKFDREELRFDIDEKGHPTRCYFLLF